MLLFNLVELILRISSFCASYIYCVNTLLLQALFPCSLSVKALLQSLPAVLSCAFLTKGYCIECLIAARSLPFKAAQRCFRATAGLLLITEESYLLHRKVELGQKCLNQPRWQTQMPLTLMPWTSPPLSDPQCWHLKAEGPNPWVDLEVVV